MLVDCPGQPKEDNLKIFDIEVDKKTFKAWNNTKAKLVKQRIKEYGLKVQGTNNLVLTDRQRQEKESLDFSAFVMMVFEDGAGEGIKASRNEGIKALQKVK